MSVSFLPALLTLALAHPGVVSRASAHPSPEIIGQRLDIRLAHPSEADGSLLLDVYYTAEVPERRVLAEAVMLEGAQRDYAARRLGELATGIKVRWNDVFLPTTSVPVDHAARNGETGFLEFHLDLRATLPGTAGTLAVSNGNYPDDQCYFATQVSMPGDEVVTATSLASVRAGTLSKSTHAAWNSKDEAREFEMTIRPASLWEKRDGVLPLPERMAGLSSLMTPRWVYVTCGVLTAVGITAAAMRLRRAR